MLEEQGIQVARRTVAKYREALKIAPANLRKALLGCAVRPVPAVRSGRRGSPRRAKSRTCCRRPTCAACTRRRRRCKATAGGDALNLECRLPQRC
jgi:hypothetical protein